MKLFLKKVFDFIGTKWYLLAIVFVVATSLVVFFRTSPIKAPKIKVSKTSEYLFEAKNADFIAQLVSTDSSRPSVSFTSKAGGKISLQMEGSSDTKAEQQGDKVVFKNVNGNSDVSYSILPNGLKEEIILNKPVDRAEFIFDVITLNAAPKKTLENTLSRYFYDNEGKYQFHLEKPFAVDANGQRTDDVIMQIRPSEADGNKYQIFISAPLEWLNNSDRAYPVIIDPTVIYAYDTQAEFAAGLLNRLKDTGTTNSPVLETYYQELPADQYTIGLWHLNEASGNALDSSGNANTGTSTGTTVVAGLLGNARSFNGTSDFLDMGNTTSLKMTGNQTIEMWLKPTSYDGVTRRNPYAKSYGGEGTITLEVGGTLTYYYGINGNDGGLYQGFGSAVAIPAGTWSHVAIVRDLTNMQLRWYVNGVQTSQTAASYSYAATSTQNAFIGKGYIGYFLGQIDDVKISNTVRTVEEIKASASRRPYGIYTSDVMDFISPVDSWNPLLWTELGVNTGDGETLKDSTGLIAQWNFNETSGGGALNNSGACGASCHLALSTASTLSQDQTPGTGWTADNRRWGVGALNFNGTSDNGTCIDPNCGGVGKLDFMSSTGWTASSWVKTTNSARQFIMAKGSTSGQYSWDLETGLNADGKASFIFNNNVDTAYIYATSTTPINDNHWHFIVGTYDGTTIKIYVDGKLESSSTTKTGTQVTNSTGSFYMGSRASSGYFSGTIDVSAVYSRALTQNEIISNYNSGNVELQTRTGDTSSADDGTWDAWVPVQNETALNSFDSDTASWPSTSPVLSSSNQSIAKVEGVGSLALNVGQLAPSSTNFASGKTYVKSLTPNATYPDTGNTELTDGLLSTGWGDGRSVGYYGFANDMVVDLSSNQNVSQVAVHFATGVSSQVYLPDQARVYTSTDNVSFTYKGKLFCPPNNASQSTTWCYVNFGLTSARYIKVEVSQPPVNTWILWSEIKVSNGDMFTVGLWRLNETNGVGSYLIDSSPTANHGTPTGTTVTSGVVSKARSFNGSSDYITAPNNSAYDLGTGDFTFSFWAKHQSVTTLNTYLEMGLYTAGVLIRQSSPTNIDVYIQYAVAADAYNFAFTPKIGEWYYFNLVRSGNMLTMYVNGVSIGSAVSSQNIQVNSQICFAMSCHSNPQKLNGSLDEVLIKNIAMTSEEISENYRLGRDRYITKTIASTDLSGKSSLPFYVAADRPGTYLTALAGETAYSNYQSDANTVALWHLEDQDSVYPRSCYALKKLGNNTDGIYYIDPDGDGGNAPFQVYCNMTYDGGGWTMAVKSWYGAGLVGKSAAVGAVADATTQKGNAYKLSDQNIRNIIGPSNNFDVMADQNGYNSAYSTGNFEYVVIRNYTAPWTYEKAMSASTTTTVWQSYRASDQALAWTGEMTCGNNDGYSTAGINCTTVVSNNPQGGLGCTINMGSTTNAGWHHFYMNNYNDDTYLYICNGAQHSSGFAMNHRFWIRERAPVKAIAENSAPTPFSQNSYIKATGGTISYLNGYTIHSFTASGTFTVTSGTGAVEALVVAGGGGGGTSQLNWYAGGGGGAGGLREGTVNVSPQSYGVTVGSGGGANIKGQDSSFGGIVSTGGGAGTGTTNNTANNSGGSGGGGIYLSPNSGFPVGVGNTPATSPVQGHDGGLPSPQGASNYGSGGGGGSGQIGTAYNSTTDGGPGGHGRILGISGTPVVYAGGGGGGVYVSNAGLGRGGGGNGGLPGVAGGSGTANTGGGGGGGGSGTASGGSGGSGVVIIRYKSPSFQNLNSTINGASLTQGKIGKARNFNGTSDQVVIPYSTSLDLNSYTLSGWFKTGDSTNYKTIITKETSPANRNFAVFIWQSGAGTYANGSLVFQTSSGGVGSAAVATPFSVADNKWHHFAAILNGTTDAKLYLDGQLVNVDSSVGVPDKAVAPLVIGNNFSIPGRYFNGAIDEIRIDSVVRTAEEIRQAYEVDHRTHPITIDFGAKLDAGNLITNSADLSFTIDATTYGLAQKGSAIYTGEKIIVKENYNGTDYVAQGTVSAVNISTGATTLISWDASSTFPSVGFSVNANLFKWQREYWNIIEPLDAHVNGVTQLAFRLSDGNEGRTIYIDDLKSNTDYLTNPSGSTVQSATGKRYFQYRVVEHSSDDAVSPSVSNVTNTAIVQIPYPPILSSGSAVSSSSIVWTHTDASSNEDGFKLYDSIGNYLNFSNTAGTTTITETGLSPDTSYSRKAAAYNTYGTSFLSGIATARTLVNVPGAVTVTRSNATTAVINSINSNSNPISAEYAVYQEVGVTCDGSGGNYVAANGSNNGSTAAWQALASWNGVTVSSLTPESEYVFCAKARNTALVETVFGPKSVTTGKIIPVTGDLTVDTNLNSATNFITRYKDGSDINRWIIGLDTVGVNSKNSSKVNLTTGSLTINSNETLVAGELNLQGGSLFIPTGGRLAIGSKLWAVDRDVDGYPDVTNGEVKLWYGEVAPANAGVPQAYFRRKGFLSTLTTVDCNDNDDIHNAICCENVGVACAMDGACCSSVCGTNADNDALFSASAGHTGTCKVAPALPYTDCNDGNANLLTTQTCYIDSDNDTYTNGTASICAGAGCTNVTGYRATSAGSDCNDANATLFRTVSGYLDADGDTYGAGSLTTCAPASGTYVANNTDCGPNTASAYPGSAACSATSFLNASSVASHDYNCNGSAAGCGTLLTASYYGSVAASNACLGKTNSCGQNGTHAVVYFNGGNVGCGVNGYYCSSSASFTDCSGSGDQCDEWGVSQCNGAALTSQTCN